LQSSCTTTPTEKLLDLRARRAYGTSLPFTAQMPLGICALDVTSKKSDRDGQRGGLLWASVARGSQAAER
jgi:hypothetical protein